jgi:trigger factor
MAERPDEQMTPELAEELELETEVKDSGPCEKTIVITASPELLQKRYQESLDEMCDTVALPGFRRGKAPRGLVEREVAATIRSQLKSQLLREGLDEAVEGLQTVGDPVLPDLDAVDLVVAEPLTFEARVEVLPNVDVQNYKAIPVEKPEVEITEADVDRELESWLRRFGRLVAEPDAAVGEDTFPVADVELREGENLVWSAEHLALDLASERLGFIPCPGLAGQAQGLKAGDEKDLPEITLDESFPVEDLREHTVTPRITLTEVRRLEIPPLNDETAKRLGFESIDELRNHMRSGLEQRRDEMEKDQMRRQIANFLLETNPLELPPRLVQRQTEENIRRTQVRLLRQGHNIQDITRMQDRILESSKDDAETSLKLTLFLRDIADKEKVYVTESELDEHIRLLAAREQTPETNMRRALERGDLIRSVRASLREDKVYDLLIDKAEISETPAETEKKPKPRKQKKGDSGD